MAESSDRSNSSMTSTTAKFDGLNVNAAEFVFSREEHSISTSALNVLESTISNDSSSILSSTQQSVDERHEQSPEVINSRQHMVVQQEQQVEESTQDNDQLVEYSERLIEDADGKRSKQINSPQASATSKESKDVVERRNGVRKESLNIVFCGHVDAGKSTIGGQLMFLTGHVDKRTLEKYQSEAREKSGESWYLSWVLDTNDEEREKGKTVEVGRAWFETSKKHFVILDAPGHKCFVPNMINGAAQADVAVLVISARRGEFETGFEREGQTREHAMLVKAAGVRHLVVLVNKMDDPTVSWNQTRYDEIRDKLIPYLKMCGFKPGHDTHFMPCSGMSGALLKDHPGDVVIPWYSGPTFIEHLDSLPSIARAVDGPLRMPIVERYRETGVIVMGKIESGCCRVGDRCLIMPNRTRVEVTNIYYENIETEFCVSGENVRLKLKNVEQEEISVGFVLCGIEQQLCGVGRVFDAQVAVIEHKSIIGPGYSAVLHIHTAAVEVQLKALIVLIDRKTGKRLQKHPRFIAQDQVAIATFELTQAGQTVCMEPYERFPQLGRFTLRDKGQTVLVGKVLKIVQ